MQFLVYILVYPLLWLISILPFRLLYVLSDAFYGLVYYIIGYRKKVVLENLKLALPDKTEQDILAIRKRFYHHLCDMMFEAIKSITISEAEMQKRYVFTNVEEIYKLEQENRSIILFMGHYASWEWIFILQTQVKHKGYAVYKNQSPKLKKALHWQNFMGKEVPVHVGAEVLAKRLDMVTLFLKVKKVKRGYYEANFTDIIRNANDYNDFELTDIYLKRVEEQIIEAPEYYFWTHKRWKHAGKKPE